MKSTGNRKPISRKELLKQYEHDIENVRNSAKELGLDSTAVDNLLTNDLALLRSETPSSNFTEQHRNIFFIKLCIVLLVIFVVYVLLNVHNPTSSIVLRNVQGLIYPGLKIVRFLSAPVIQRFSSLTTLYDESCLVENPYFYVSDMECWPCQNVHSVIDLTKFDNQSLYQSGMPFIMKYDWEQISFAHLKDLYTKNHDIFNKDANNIKSTNSSINNLQDLFSIKNAQMLDHIVWRINRMYPAIIIRKIFPRPSFISEWSGQSIERFVLIDGPKAAPYTLPNTECSYVFLIQRSGERTVILKPSKECSNECKTVSVVLKPSEVLWYNWWYWRPISLPTENSTTMSISYLNSYC